MKNHELITASEEMMKSASDAFFKQFIEWANSSDCSCSDWIPEENVRPEVGEPVLVTLWNGDVTIGIWWGYRWATLQNYSEDVLAWMPRPRPYIPN